MERRMFRTNDTRIPWDLLTFGLVVFFAMFQVMQWPDLPRFMDIYYHLSVANGFSTAGGYVPQAFWEYAPVGRPHLYPPLLHIIMLGLSKLGLSWISVGRLVECLALPSFLAALWAAVRKLHSPGAAFFSVLVASSIFSLYLDVGILLPFTLALILGLLAITAINGGKVFAGAILLGLAFYSHVYMATMFMLALVLYAFLTRHCRPRAFVAILLAVLLAAPLFVHMALHQDFYTHVSVRESRVMEVHPLVYLLAAVGLAFAVRGRGNWAAPTCIALAMLPLLFTHNVRFLGGYGLVGFIWLAGMGLYEVGLRFAGTRRVQVCFIAAALLVFFGLAPVVHISTPEKTYRVAFLDSTVTHFFLPDQLRTERSKEHSIYGLPGFPLHYAKVAAAVSAHSTTNDIIWADSEYQGAIVALLAGRATSSATLREIRPYKPFEAAAFSRILVWFRKPDEDIRIRTMPVAARYNLQPIAETEIACVFLNPAHCPKAFVPEPLLRAEWIGLIFLVLTLLAALDGLKKQPGPRHYRPPRPTGTAGPKTSERTNSCPMNSASH